MQSESLNPEEVSSPMGHRLMHIASAPTLSEFEGEYDDISGSGDSSQGEATTPTGLDSAKTSAFSVVRGSGPGWMPDRRSRPHTALPPHTLGCPS
jgi:hypothetical protein